MRPCCAPSCCPAKQARGGDRRARQVDRGAPKGSSSGCEASSPRPRASRPQEDFAKAESPLPRRHPGNTARRRRRPGPRLQHAGRLPPRRQPTQGRSARLSPHRPAVQQRQGRAPAGPAPNRSALPPAQASTHDDADLSKGGLAAEAGPPFPAARQGRREEAEHHDRRPTIQRSDRTRLFREATGAAMPRDRRRQGSAARASPAVDIRREDRASPSSGAGSNVSARHRGSPSPLRELDQIAGSSYPLRGSRESRALASGSFLKRLGLGVPARACGRACRRCCRGGRCWSSGGRSRCRRSAAARDFRQSRKLRTWASWPSTPLADSALEVDLADRPVAVDELDAVGQRRPCRG